ncbi:MAG: exonuclease domain-containing protein [Moraxellaceae bacterium]|nr:exonuclease domain-containing protein [Moraxellaceae bacterium]MDP1775785.1 exonuclease domain-containing protein [Moraxellaceae bacterium]
MNALTPIQQINPLRGFSQPLAIVDLETTGGRALVDRITEIGVILVDEHGVREWSSLVNPQLRIPPFITQLTGISNDTVADAPLFADLAGTLHDLLKGRLFIAHNARFDYGFLKAEFERIGLRFQVRSLCSVRLSRALNPTQQRHNLDAVMSQYRIHADKRHRALDDARVVYEFLSKAEIHHGANAVAQAVSLLSKRPSLPAYLDESLADELPEGPGVYFFHGEADLLYVGKAKNIRARVLSHFSADLKSTKEARLSQQVRRITWEATAGELGALLLEARYVKTLQPLHNRQLRRQANLVSLTLKANNEGLLMPQAVSGHELRSGTRLYGLFNSRAATVKPLRQLALEHGLCDYAMGLERMAKRPCPSRQLKRCQGLCDGNESINSHNQRLLDVLEEHALKAWPFQGMVALEERNHKTNERAYYLVDNWCWLGTAHSLEALNALAQAPMPPVLDKDSYRLLLKAILGPSPLTVHQPNGHGS